MGCLLSPLAEGKSDGLAISFHYRTKGGNASGRPRESYIYLAELRLQKNGESSAPFLIPLISVDVRKNRYYGKLRKKYVTELDAGVRSLLSGISAEKRENG